MNNKWISVEELPAHGQKVWIYGIDGYYMEVFTFFEKGANGNPVPYFASPRCTISLDENDITHWQPLPPPPTVDEMIKESKELNTTHFIEGNYSNKCTYCGEVFYNTDKLWFICPDCCADIGAAKLKREKRLKTNELLPNLKKSTENLSKISDKDKWMK